MTALHCPFLIWTICAGSSSADEEAVSDSSVDESGGERDAPLSKPLAQHRKPFCSLSASKGNQPSSGLQQLRKGPGAGASKENMFSLGRRAGEGCLPGLDPYPSGQAVKRRTSTHRSAAGSGHLCSVQPLVTLSQQGHLRVTDCNQVWLASQRALACTTLPGTAAHGQRAALARHLLLLQVLLR